MPRIEDAPEAATSSSAERSRLPWRRTGSKQELPQALVRLQLRWRENCMAMEEPKIEVARAYADGFLPRARDGQLYRAIGLPEPCRRWKDGAPTSLAVFDKMGVNIGLYMRLVYACIPLFALLSVFALVPIVYNLTGSYIQDNQLHASHTLGNAPELLPLHGITDLCCVLTMVFAVVKGTQVLRRESERIEPLRPSQLSAAHYTLFIKGMPRSSTLQAADIRSFFEQWGEVVSVALSRANAKLIKLVRKRDELNFRVQQQRVAATRARRKAGKQGGAYQQISKKDAVKLQSLNEEIAKLRNQVFPTTGICFVTFNEQRSAHTCLASLRDQRTAHIAGEEVRLRASFAPSPDNLIWENLEHTACSLWLRRFLVNCILLVQCLISTYAIVEVTNRSIDKGLDEDAGFIDKMLTAGWTTVIIIASNLCIFILAPIYMDAIERDYTQDLRETALAGKLLIFQVVNGMAASLSFLWTKENGIKGIFDRDWYSVGAATVLNTLIADALIINLGVEGFRIFDALPLRLFVAPRAATQVAMNRTYAVTNPLYLPFRMQLTLKFFVYGVGFAYGIPALYPLTLAFFLVSWVTDRSGLLRIFHGILVTTDKMVLLLGMIDTCPWAIVLHCFLSFLCTHNFQVGQLGLEPKEGLFVAFKELEHTIDNFSVALSAVLLMLSLVFAVVFVVREKSIRAARKERQQRKFFQLPKVGTPAFVQLKKRIRSKVKSRGRGRTRLNFSRTTANPSSDTSATTGPDETPDEVREADLVPFRELHAYGATPKLYIPPLTANLLASLSTQAQLKRRHSSANLTDRTGELHVVEGGLAPADGVELEVVSSSRDESGDTSEDLETRPSPPPRPSTPPQLGHELNVAESAL